MYTPPRICTTVETVRLPTPPKQWKYTPIGTSHNYPVLFFGPYTYTALSNVDNGYTMQIVAWDVERELAGQWIKTGARFLQQISYNANTQTVTFTGEDNGSVSATLDELVVGPHVVKPLVSAGPSLPYTLTYSAPTNAQFPVIKSGPFSFWPVSYADGRDSFCVVVVDEDNVIRKLVDCPGSHNISKIVVDDAQRTIELIGKNNVAARFDYNVALTCFSCSYVYTKDDFAFLAEYFKVLLSDTQALALTENMPIVDCSLCYRMNGLGGISEPDFLQRRAATDKHDTLEHVEDCSKSGTTAGSLLGTVAGSFGGFFIGGLKGALAGLNAGAAAGAAIGPDVIPSSDTDEYQLSSVEQRFSLIGYKEFPCGPFKEPPVSSTVFKSSFPLYEPSTHEVSTALV